MQRKLVQQGASTLMVSLPRTWIKEQGLARGKIVDVSQESGAIVVRASGSARVRETAINLSGEDESLIRTLITNTYRTGIDKTTVTFDSEKQYKLLQNTVKTKLLGFQITQKDKKSCVIESVTEPDAAQFDNILSKFFLSAKQLLLLAHDRASGQAVSEDIDELEDRIIQYENFCLRCLSREARSSAVDFLQLFIHSVNHGQRECYLALSTIKKSTVDASFSASCVEILALLVEAYTNRTTEKLHKIHSIEVSTRKSLQSSRKGLPMSSHYLANSLRHLYLANSPLAGWIMLTGQRKQ